MSGVSDAYWLASRTVNCSNNSCNFAVRCVDHNAYDDDATWMIDSSGYYPNDYTNMAELCLRPIINLTSNIKMEYAGASSTEGYNTWNIQ